MSIISSKSKLISVSLLIFVIILINATQFTALSTSSETNELQENRDLIVNLPELGVLRGATTTTARTNETIYQFLGVKYAESPSGHRRFKAPVSVKSWNGVRDATKYGRPCPQLGITDKLTQTEWTDGDLEDCLSLCVYTKNLDKMAHLPVMVYVHGGTFYRGTSYFFPPTYYLERDIVLVVPQFRVDALGFLSTKSDEIPGNAGLLDVIEALYWVQRNIKYFGGSAQRVTLFGQSAGASMVSALALSPLVPAHLFQKIILQSGTAFTNRAYDRNPVENARDIARRAGLKENLQLDELNDEFMRMDVLQMLRATHEHNNDNLINGYNKMGGRCMTLGGPTNLLPESAYDIVRSGQYRRDLAVMAGTLKHEGSFLVVGIYDMLKSNGLINASDSPEHNLIATVTRILGADDDAGGAVAVASNLHWTREQILRNDFGELARGFIDMVGTYTIKAAILRAVQANARYNPNNTFLYSFEYRGEHTRFDAGDDGLKYPFDGGVYHSNDNIYLFPYPDAVVKLNETDTKMSRKMVNLWTSFAADGRPNVGDDDDDDANSIEWPPFTDSTGPYLRIDKNCSIGYYFIEEFTAATREAKENNKI